MSCWIKQMRDLRFSFHVHLKPSGFIILNTRKKYISMKRYVWKEVYCLLFLSIHLHPLSHIEYISDHSQVFVTRQMYWYKWTTDRSESQTESEIANWTWHIRHSHAHVQITTKYTSFLSYMYNVYQMMINDKWRKLLYWSR